MDHTSNRQEVTGDGSAAMGRDVRVSADGAVAHGEGIYNTGVGSFIRGRSLSSSATT